MNSVNFFVRFSPSLFYQPFRSSSFLTHLPAQKLWDSTSPIVKRTGRGKRAKVIKREDLGRNHQFGEGKLGIVWPGLNSSLSSKLYQRNEDEQKNFLKEIEERKSARKAPPREKVRGWSGAQWGGVKLGPIEPINGVSFDEFQSVILGVQRVSHMTGRQGRVYSVKATVAIGNGEGVIGIFSASASEITAAVRKARNRAAKRLTFIERFEDRTVFEDMFVNYHHTTMYIRQQPPGYGLRCHRAVTELCKLIGIKDLYVKTFGAKTIMNVHKCFIKGLLEQESHQKKADKTGYHVVRCDELRGFYPEVLASPQNGKVKKEEFDEMNSYLTQDLLLREFKNIENLRESNFSKNQITNNRGIPVPPCQRIPEDISNIRDFRL